MKTHFITVDNAWPALKEKGMAGALPPEEVFPLHAFGPELHYTILPNGILSCLFDVRPNPAIEFGRILEGMPPCSGLQLYSHHHPETGDRSFLSLSGLVEYRSPFAPLQGFGSLLSGSAISKEIERLELSTRETYGTLIRSAEKESPYLQLMGNPTPLLQILGPLRLSEASLECKEAITYNLSYLLLGPARLALLVEFNAFPGPSEFRLPHPSRDLEYLSATCIHQPQSEDLARLDTEVEDYLTFLHYFRKAGTRSDSGFPSLDQSRRDPGITLKGRILAKHYVLLFGTTLTDLRLKAQDYFRDLCSIGISFHASMIRTRDNYSHLYPGNFRLLNDGLRLDSSQVQAVLRRLHL